MRFIPLGCGAIALIAGLLTGLARLGLQVPVPVPVPATALAEFHCPFMIAGFLGTLISLERAVAIGRWWAYVAPALSAAGALALVAGFAALAAVVLHLRFSLCRIAR